MWTVDQSESTLLRRRVDLEEAVEASVEEEAAEAEASDKTTTMKNPLVKPSSSIN